MGVAPSAAGDDLTACDAYVNHHEVLAVARQIRHGALDVEPAWTLPDFESLTALRRESSRENRAIRLASCESAPNVDPALINF
jgi:hypothetical protein